MLQEKLRELARLNHNLEDVNEIVSENQKLLEGTPQYIALKKSKATAKDIQTSAQRVRSEINTLTLEAYQQTGEKKPAPCVGIRVGQSFVYDTDQALNYCLAELPEALKLDKRTFEKYVKGMQEIKPLDFVTIEEKITPTIASDLSEYLEPSTSESEE